MNRESCCILTRGLPVSRCFREMATAALLAALAFCPGAAWSQAYPSKPIRLIVSSAPQGGTDTIARIVGAQLSEGLGQQVIVDNRPGATGQIGVALLTKSPPDGYTLLMSGSTSLVIVPHTYSKVPYDVARDLQPVSMVATSDYILAVHPSLPVKTVKDLISLAKARPGQIAYASGGRASISHLAGELLKQRAGIDLLHVPYKGGGPAALALLSGEASLMFGTGPTVASYANTGKLRLIAIASEKRSKSLPNLPTIQETVPGILVSMWYGIQVPAGTPRPIVARLNSEIAKAVTAEKVVRAIAGAELEPMTNSPEEFSKLIREETARWGQAVKAARIVAE